MQRIDRRELAAIFVGGGVGTVLRIAVAQVAGGGDSGWPWATFAVNIVGAFVLGYAATRLQERLPLSSYRRPFLGTGICGGLTTFSTMQIELLRMIDDGRIGLAATYTVVSVIAGCVGVLAATSIVRRARVIV